MRLGFNLGVEDLKHLGVERYSICGFLFDCERIIGKIVKMSFYCCMTDGRAFFNLALR